MDRYERIARGIFTQAGVEVDGPQPWDIQVKDRRFYRRLVLEGSMGFAESFLDGWWECGSMYELTLRLYRAGLYYKVKMSRFDLAYFLLARLFNWQNASRATQVTDAHYDLSNEFFEHLLGPNMLYTCAYWKGATTLEEAQAAKLDLICRKLKLRAGERVLELGCGWGTFARYAAEKFGCRVDAVNVAALQSDYARRVCRDLPVAVHTCDFRQVEAYNPSGTRFDKVVAIGLGEHVGPKNFRTFFSVVDRQLKPGGLFFTHQVGTSVTRAANHPFLQKYIFPNAVVPSPALFAGGAESVNFMWQDFHDIGKHYVPTLAAWHRNLFANRHRIKTLNPARFDERFFRLWDIYLGTSMAVAETRDSHLHQYVFAKPPYEADYETER